MRTATKGRVWEPLYGSGRPGGSEGRAAGTAGSGICRQMPGHQLARRGRGAGEAPTARGRGDWRAACGSARGGASARTVPLRLWLRRRFRRRLERGSGARTALTRTGERVRPGVWGAQEKKPGLDGFAGVPFRVWDISRTAWQERLCCVFRFGLHYVLKQVRIMSSSNACNRAHMSSICSEV